ncbi:HlyD family secretion protein [Hymenobacter cellulosivorans]|uniref:HlyD family efflux transporter periplasmic adaptor subunit n=1 Tax=Hymenobacter cellulosivorans TaxID=2932249 RepID=A0ABY4F8L3_9BACT|nr:HlyD family secretion protein [Hymenobacter cellulosivorans]UOQ52367.1 HlyD family efflux transporter periplasmic adaptor subunit [Hymenobacter cellulosivorans]
MQLTSMDTHRPPVQYSENTATNNLRTRSEEMQDIIEKIPAWITRWGISLIFILLLLVIWGSYEIKYPDILKASLRLTTQNFPKVVNSRIEGKLIKLLVKNQQSVESGVPVAYLESTAEHEEVQRLETWLEAQEQALQSSQNISRNVGFDYNQLGELQNDFQIFDRAKMQYEAFAVGGYYQHKRLLLQSDLVNLKKQQISLLAQKELYKQDIILAQQEFEAQKKLFAQKVIASLDYNQQQSKFLNRQFPLKQIELSAIANLAQQSSKQSELLDLDDLASKQQGIYIQALRSLKSAVAGWKSKYILSSPIAGSVIFTSFLQEKQIVQSGQELFFVIPHSDKIFGEIKIPQYNLGKVRTGQRVLLKFSSYPFQEFGAVRGTIDYISDIPAKDGSFLARVVLPEGLTTTYHRQIVYRAGMEASAEIITDDLRLLARIFYNFRKIMSR